MLTLLLIVLGIAILVYAVALIRAAIARIGFTDSPRKASAAVPTTWR